MKALLLTVLSFLIVLTSISQTTSAFTSSGSWLCPAGVTSVQVEAWGGGGGGGGAANTTNACGGGGGGGAYAIRTSVTVVPGTTYTITIGAAGTAGTTSANGGAGGNTTITMEGVTTTAAGGSGGAYGLSGALNGVAGAGGTTGSSSGGTVYAGGAGASGASSNGGGGGSGAGSTGTGNAASGTTAGAAKTSNGGAGGAGGTSGGGGNNGSAGSTYGGGGGGGSKNKTGGAGAAGYVVITYTCPSEVTANAGADQTLAACATTATLAGNTPSYGTGTWTVVSGTATITSANSPTSGVTGLVIGSSATLRWTISNGVCGSTTDDVVITAVIGAGCWTYCASTGTTSTAGYVSRVQFNTIDRTSTWDGGYYDASGTSTTVWTGSSYDLTLTRYDASTYTLYTAAWIDFNNDGDFADAGENIMTSASSTTSGNLARTVSVTIPSDATTGSTRLRVMMKYNAAITGSCENNTYQETEDFTVNISSCTAPTTQATSLTSSSITSTTMTIGWTRGNGDGGVVVLARAGGAVNSDVISNTTYTANAAFGSGDQVGTGNYVIYKGTGTSVNLTGLTSSTTYYFAVYEYNSSSTCFNYTELTGNATAISCSAPSTQASSMTFSGVTPTKTTVKWTRGNGTGGVIVVAKSGSSVNVDPTSGTTYSGNSVFGSGDNLGSSNYVIYKGTGTSVSVTGLTASTTYYYAVYEYDSTDVCINATELAGNQATQCSSTGTTNTAGYVKQVQFNGINRSSTWDGGYYDATSTSTDVSKSTSYDLILTRYDNSTYTLYTAAWIDFNGDGDFTDAGENVMTSSSSSTAGSVDRTVSVSIPAGATTGTSTLRVMMKYNAAITGPCENNTYQETEDYTVNIIDGCSGPGTQATSFTTSSITTTSMTVGWTRGSGTGGVLVVAKSGSAVSLDPTSGTTYTANAAFGSGDDLGSSNYVVYKGTGTSVNITGLTSGITYHYAIYEYNTSGTCFNLIQLSGNQVTTPPATLNPISWDGGAGNGDFNNAINWSGNVLPSVGDSVIINLTANKTITLSANIAIGALHYSASGSNVVTTLDCVSYLLTINGNLHMLATGNSNTVAYLDLGSSAGGITVGRHAFFDDGGDAASYNKADVSSPGTFTFKGNVTIGPYGRTAGTVEPDITFDGTGNQSVVVNDLGGGTYYFLAETLRIGSVNNPTVTLSGTGTTDGFGCYDGAVYINGTSVLDISSKTINRFAGSGGSITIANGATLKIGGTGTFPSNYTTNTLNPTSNVRYNGTTQAVRTLTYGNLYLETSGTKTISGATTVAGNTTLSGTATLDNNSTIDFNGNITIGNGTTFLGGTGTNTIAGNWENNGTFTKETSTISFDGSSAQVISGTGATTFNNLTIENASGGVSLSVDATAQNTLTLTNGLFSVQGYTLSIGSTSGNGTVSGGSATAYIVAYDNSGTIGYVKEFVNSNTAYSYPIGNTASYTPLTFTLASGTLSNAYLTVYTINSKVSGLSSAITTYLNRSWDATPSGITSPNYTISYTYVDGDLVGSETGMLPIKKSGATWYKPTGSSFTDATAQGTGSFNAGTNTLTWSGLSTFSILGGVPDNPVPLPIELLSFDGQKDGKNNLLIWETASETNNDFFTIEKTVDGENYDIVGLHDAAGNSTQYLHYSLIDTDVREVINYYRLKQTDFDGKYTFSPIISIDNRINTENKAIIMITNILGQEVNEFYRGVVVILYSDGTSKKVIQ